MWKNNWRSRRTLCLVQPRIDRNLVDFAFVHGGGEGGHVKVPGRGRSRDGREVETVAELNDGELKRREPARRIAFRIRVEEGNRRATYHFASIKSSQDASQTILSQIFPSASPSARPQVAENARSGTRCRPWSSKTPSRVTGSRRSSEGSGDVESSEDREEDVLSDSDEGSDVRLEGESSEGSA